MKLDKIRQVLEDSKAETPWNRIYGGNIKSFSNEKLKALFSPTLNYIQYKKHEFIIQQVNECKIPLPVLEIGAGTCSLMRSLAKKSNKDFVCLDINEEALKCGEILAEAEGIKNIRFITGNFSIDKCDDRYSIIIIDSVLEHIIEYKAWVDSIEALLDNNGLCIVIVPSIYGGYSMLYDFNWKTLRWKVQPYNYHPGMHVNHFLFKEIVEYFESRGMKLSRVFKFQAYYAILRLIMDKTRLIFLDNLCSVVDYYIAKIIPRDASTRVMIFHKEKG